MLGQMVVLSGVECRVSCLEFRVRGDLGLATLVQNSRVRCLNSMLDALKFTRGSKTGICKQMLPKQPYVLHRWGSEFLTSLRTDSFFAYRAPAPPSYLDLKSISAMVETP